jgi:hypothetical protein
MNTRSVELFFESYGLTVSAGSAIGLILISPILFKWLRRPRVTLQARFEWCCAAVVYVGVGLFSMSYLLFVFPAFLFLLAAIMLGFGLLKPSLV